MPSTADTAPEKALVGDLLARVAQDLGQLLDREIVVENVRAQRVKRRAAGPRQVHVSFKLNVRGPRGEGQGCFLVPLPDAMALAACLLMAPEDEVARARAAAGPDGLTKDALIELDNFLAGACDAVLRDWNESVSIQPGGCQGVRADVRPALDYVEGDGLVLGSARMRSKGFEPFELLVLLPELLLSAGT
jgi:hypothetical protein